MLNDNYFSNIKTICYLPGGESFNWFCIVTCSIELKFCKALEPILSILSGVELGDTEKIITNLNVVTECLKDVKSEIGKLHEKLTGEVFFKLISPYLSGWDGELGTPPGLIFDGIENNHPLKLPSGNAGQSAIIQIMDALLGIEHSEEKTTYLKFVRSFIIPKHCQFIEDIRNIHKPLKNLIDNSTDEELKKTYRNCVDALTSFRSYHIQVVTKYMVIPDRKMKRESGNVDINDPGTSGVITFLKELRQDTKNTTTNS
ncbi:hypothetical protein LOTGIDRAFT_168391 [Lottia gigantea]|uniref:Indoleamine 2,3-dioxygenase n=1 Tax=Lottia gigantea TaxID=225164 RepID=V3ZKC9_LOTGI|nr:hypothetical protein LOTGIDRAFT_168391 [Lottia gigantea]ESO84727.1 hypothetical protein LOTGIDRAFT_168391 [Lottia gigantea]